MEDIRDAECFNSTLEEYKVIYPDGKSNYISKDGFDGHSFISKYLKEIYEFLIFLFLNLPVSKCF